MFSGHLDPSPRFLRQESERAGRILACMRVNLFSLVFLALACALPLAVSGEDGAAILAHHRAFVGWQADDAGVQSLKLTYVIAPRRTPAPSSSATPLADAAPAREPSVTEYRHGLVYRDIERTGRGLSVGEGFNGKQFWRSDESGNTVVVLEKELRLAFTENVVDAEAAVLVPSVARGTAQVDSKIADVVRITPPDGVPADLYVERATGAYLRVVYDPDDRFDSYSIDIIAYRDLAPGKKIVSETRGTTRGAVLRLATAELNPTIDPADLRIPRPASSWTFGSTEPYPITVAIEARAGRSVRVRASINGHEGTFLLDSGSSDILVFTPYADTIGLEELGRSAYTGVNGGVVGAKLARVKDLAIGANVLHNVVVNVSSRGFSGVDGILGYPLLANAIVDVDLNSKAMTILDPTKFDATVGKGAFGFPVDLTTFQPGVIMSFPKGVVAHPVLDSGNEFNVLLAEDMLRSGKVTGVADTITIGGVGEFENYLFLGGVDGSGTQKAPCIRTNMSVGPYRYQQALTCFAPGNVFGSDGGLIGFDFMRHFNWTFDYPEAKLVLTPNGL